MNIFHNIYVYGGGISIRTFFTSSNGVKQGGILSPLFFNVYMDNLSSQLSVHNISAVVPVTLL